MVAKVLRQKGEREIYKIAKRKTKVHRETVKNALLCINVYNPSAYISIGTNLRCKELTRLLILISEYGRKTVICNKVIICWWRSWRET